MPDGLELPPGLLPPSGDAEASLLDAQAILAQAIVTSSAAINADFVRAAVFLPLYLGAPGRELVDQLLVYKARQSPGAMRHLRDAIKAFAALDLIKPFTVGGFGGGK